MTAPSLTANSLRWPLGELTIRPYGGSGDGVVLGSFGETASTVARHPRAWREVSVEREWTMPEWFLEADAELPGTNEP